MKKIINFLAVALTVILCLGTEKNYIFAEESNQIIANEIIGKTSIDTSIYGDDLEYNMVEESPGISNFSIKDRIVNIVGYVDSNDSNTEFCLTGIAYRTYDNNIVCDAMDSSGKYDVVFVCLEKKQEYNDYILYRDNLNEMMNEMGEYGLKIYLMKKGTRDLSILEDLNVEITNISEILNNLDETDYSKLNWFTYCFLPTHDESDNIEPYSTNTTSYTYWDDKYYIGTDTIQLGVKLKATNDTPAVANNTDFTSKLEFEFVIETSNPAYNNPYRGDGHFRIENVKIQALIGQGYYIQHIAWNGDGEGITNLSPSLGVSVGISYGVLGANISISPTTYSLNKDNTLNLVDSQCDYNTKMPRQVEIEYDNIILSGQRHYLDFLAHVVDNDKISEKFKMYQTYWTFDVATKGYYNFSVVDSNHLYCTNWL